MEGNQNMSYMDDAYKDVMDLYAKYADASDDQPYGYDAAWCEGFAAGIIKALEAIGYKVETSGIPDSDGYNRPRITSIEFVGF